MKRIAYLLSASMLVVAAAPAPHPVGPDDIAKVKSVGDPQVDPAGQWVAYSVRETDVAADKQFSHLWMTRWDGSRTVQVTSRKDESESTPRFSPDGKWLAFISGRADEKGNGSLWLLDRSGGEGLKMPGIKGSVGDIVWSPDGKTIALVVTDPEPEDKPAAKPAAKPATPPADADANPESRDEEADAPKKDDKKPKPIVIERFQFKSDGAGYLGKQHNRLWLYDLATHKARRLTTGNFDEALPAWSPDGKSIAFTSNRTADPDRNYDTNLYVIAAGEKPGDPRALTSYAGADNDDGWGSYPAWSPDGKQIAYLEGGPVELIGYGVRKLAVVPAAGGARRVLTAGLDRNVNDPAWTSDGKSIRISVEDDEVVRLAEVPLAGGAPRDVASGFRVISSPVAGPGGALAVTLSDPAHPAEIYALEAKGGLRQLSHQNDAWLKTVALAPVARTAFKSADGTEVHGFLVTPPGVAAKNLPTILYNHGGPQSQFDAGFNMTWQIFAGHGYAVVSTNPRGGTGRGEAYAKALYANWGGPAVPDALAGVDDAVARGIADPKRLYVGGWSYGGMLTNYLIASDTRFKAAVSGASISNVLAGYGTDQYIRDYETELGRPWEHMDVWLRNSYPFYHNEKIVTPTLWMVGDKDFNVPLLNSEQMYQALKSRSINTSLIIYPGEHHGLGRPSFLKDRMDRWLAWYDRQTAP
ncbi:MAG: S9 family peptidase [Sphingomonas sp.]|jgi:dipeptidyl aminopeptidase/acylaminoacyl peptidase